MFIKYLKYVVSSSVLSLLNLSYVCSESTHQDEHGGQIFHRFILEADIGNTQEGGLASWDFDGWVGTDHHKLWLKAEGARLNGKTENAELWGLYSYNMDTFWDGQIGIRHDIRPQVTNYLTIGVEGLAPLFLETEAHIFISNKNDVSFRLYQATEMFITQVLILQPYYEVGLFLQDVPEQDIGSGISVVELGLQLRYEITRKLAPYVDIHYERKLGETATIAKAHQKRVDDVVGTIGIRLMF